MLLKSGKKICFETIKNSYQKGSKEKIASRGWKSIKGTGVVLKKGEEGLRPGRGGKHESARPRNRRNAI